MSYSNFMRPRQKTAMSHVGNNSKEDNNKDYIKNQSEILYNQKQNQLGKIPPNVSMMSNTDLIQGTRYGFNNSNYKTSESIIDGDKILNNSYDPYHAFLNSRGLLKENTKSLIRTEYIDINSQARTTRPTMVTINDTKLSEDPLSFDTISISVGINSSRQNLLKIYYPGHNLTKNKRITLTGIEKTSKTINSIYGTNKNAIIFTPGSIAVAFLCNFDDIDTNMSFDPNFKVGDGIDYSTLKAFDTSNLTVSISGFDISTSGTPYVGNIPINFLNSTHTVYFTNPNFTVKNGVNIYSSDTLINVPNTDNVVKKITGFYIKLPFSYVGTQPTNNQTVTLTFNYIGGIPINKINAEYPIDLDHTVGYHEVYSTTTDTISILLNNDTYYVNPTVGNMTATQALFGGDNVYIATVSEIISGFSTPNEYKVELPKIFPNVIMAKLVSTTFPNTFKVFSNNPLNKNNKLYWQNQDDGDFIYSIELEPGNYTPGVLASLIGSSVYKIKRRYAITSTTSAYTDSNFMNVTIDINTDKVTIQSYREAKIDKPIASVTPSITDTNDPSPPYTLVIQHPSHGLKVGDDVLFTGMIATFGISDSVLNGVHTITSVPTTDSYTIVIDSINLLSSRVSTGGGHAAKIYVPSSFRLLFNYPDTMGEQLGFRNVGESFAITPFATTITNADAYSNEIVTVDDNGLNYVLDESGNKLLLKNNALKLSGYDYIIMVIREFANITCVNKNKDITKCFAKINFPGITGRLEYDSYVSTPTILYEPIDLSELNISYFAPDGTLYDFNGFEHSFMLELTSITYVPDETGIDTTHSAF